MSFWSLQNISFFRQIASEKVTSTKIDKAKGSPKQNLNFRVYINSKGITQRKRYALSRHRVIYTCAWLISNFCIWTIETWNCFKKKWDKKRNRTERKGERASATTHTTLSIHFLSAGSFIVQYKHKFSWHSKTKISTGYQDIQCPIFSSSPKSSTQPQMQVVLQ